MRSSQLDAPNKASTHAINTGLVLTAELGAALAATTTFQELLKTLRSHLKWVLAAEYVSLCLLEEGEQHYRVITIDQEDRCYTVDEGLVGWSLRHNVSLDVPDLLDETRLPPGVGGVALHRGHGSLLVLPLQTDQRLLGALTMGSSLVGAYTQVDHGLITLITSQVTSAVRAALLVADLDGAEDIIVSMARAVEAKDPYTNGHAQRVTGYAIALAEAAHLSYAIRDVVACAGPLHDVGKIGIPDNVLCKPGRLTDEEFDLIKKHPEIGEEICRPLRSLRRLLSGIRHHHERYDGRGYPDGLVGEHISLEARVLAIADTYDAMTSNRSYRQGLSHVKAISIIAANVGPQWDPALVSVFCTLPTTADGKVATSLSM